MEEPRHIVILGNSIILSSIVVNLRLCSQYEVITLSPTPDPVELDTSKPNLMIFDLGAPRPEAAFKLLEASPSLSLLGISPDKNEMQMWTGRQLKELSTQELLDLINEQLELRETIL